MEEEKKPKKHKADESIQENQVTELIRSSANHMRGRDKDFIIFVKRKSKNHLGITDIAKIKLCLQDKGHWLFSKSPFKVIYLLNCYIQPEQRNIRAR